MVFGLGDIGFNIETMSFEATNISSNEEKLNEANSTYKENIDYLKEKWEGDLGDVFKSYMDCFYGALNCTKTSENMYKDNQFNFYTDCKTIDENFFND